MDVSYPSQITKPPKKHRTDAANLTTIQFSLRLFTKANRQAYTHSAQTASC